MMKTSNQLMKRDFCANNNNASVSMRSGYILNAQIQKEVLKMALNGEIPKDRESIRDALMSGVIDKDIKFETRYQQEDLINLWTDRIKRYVDWEQRDLIFPEREETPVEDADADLLLPDKDGNLKDTNIRMFDEDIKVIPDYITKNGNVVTIGKIKTGRVPKGKNKLAEEQKANEIYAYGLLGKKLYPDARIEIEIDHLGDTEAKNENVLMHLSYEPDIETAKEALSANWGGTYQSKIDRIAFTDELAQRFESDHLAAMQEDEISMDEDCASCPKFNICNYTEPPISMDTELSVRPISEIRLTDEQQEAVNYRHGTVRINAGAGAGKTLVVAWRVKEMIKEGIDPKDILLITFTNAGANEMKARVEDYCAAEGVEYDHEALTMTTFNAYCQSIVNDHFEELGFSRPPRVIPVEIKMDRINQILSRYPRVSIFNYGQTYGNGKWESKTRALPYAMKFFDEIKERGYTREENPWNNGKVWYEEWNQYVDLSKEDKDLIFSMYEDYDHTIKSEDFIDYADQMALTQKLLTMHPDLFDQIGKKHIIVDEFQDTDMPQIELLQKMKDASSFESLMCVGDDSQAIFSFRHTSPEYLINFEKYLGDGNETVGYRCDNIDLVENHRSTADIIDFANSINRLNENRVDKDLIATKDYETPVDVRGYYSKHQEYVDIAQRIAHDIENGTKPYDIAFLARNRSELVEMAGELTKLNIGSIMIVPQPYLADSNVAAAQTFFDSFLYNSTQGIMDYINAKGHGSLIGATREEIEEKIKDFKAGLGDEPLTTTKFIEYVRALDPEGRDECLNDFIETKLKPCRDMDEMKDFFRVLKLYGNENSFKREGRSAEVCLSTIHSAKGLEWDKVYYSVDNLDKPKFHKGFNQARYMGEKEEENRLHFVAASRAKSEVHCSGCYCIDTRPSSGYPENTVLKQAFAIVDKPFIYQTSQLRAVYIQENKEKRERSEEERHQTGRRVARIREMTPQELNEYRAMTDGAEQLNLFDLDNSR